MRVFSFSTVAPQITMTLLMAFIGPRLTEDTAHYVMLAGGAMMAAAGLLVLAVGGRFGVSHEEW